ncbi:MAG TPA: hypothetical protein DD429_09670 [Clostridiaceae bacterium]|mgnify:CR=1 FL=1|nr:hypothetical protein [Clostridiaceae bacterium]
MIASKIAGMLKEKDNIAIVSHVMADGDSIGSMLALYNALKKMNKNVSALTGDKLPKVYSFLPGFQDIRNCDSLRDKNYDLLIVLDCGSLDRIGLCSSIKAGMIINIDHHITNSNFGDLNLVDAKASSTGEIVYQIIKLMGVDISKDEAVCLYTAILTDTGCFKYSNTTLATHQIAGDLITYGFDFGKIHDMVYSNYEYDCLKLLGKALSSLQLYEGGRIALMELLYDDFKGINLEDISTSEFIDYARDIGTVEEAAFIKETSLGEFKVSFRSKRIVDVRAICEKYGGGGHIRAAGCTITGDLKYVRDTVINEMKKALKDEMV